MSENEVNESMVIKLISPIEVAGKAVEKLEMREPLVSDITDAEEQAFLSGKPLTEALRTVYLLAKITNIPPSSLQKLTGRDYANLQKKLAPYVTPTQ